MCNVTYIKLKYINQQNWLIMNKPWRNNTK